MMWLNIARHPLDVIMFETPCATQDDSTWTSTWTQDDSPSESFEPLFASIVVGSRGPNKANRNIVRQITKIWHDCVL